VEREIVVGDTIVFRVVTRWGAPKLTRKVVEISGQFGIGVNAHTCRPFWVRRDEVIEVVKEEKA